jgi:chemotaxis signal transduction protein
MTILCFKIDDQRFAVSIEVAERVIMAQAITPVPDSPGLLLGIIDYYGQNQKLRREHLFISRWGKPAKNND